VCVFSQGTDVRPWRKKKGTIPVFLRFNGSYRVCLSNRYSPIAPWVSEEVRRVRLPM